MKYYITQQGLDLMNEVSLDWIAKKSAAGDDSREFSSRSKDRDAAMARIRKRLGDRSGGADAPEARTMQHSFLARRRENDPYTNTRDNFGKGHKLRPKVKMTDKDWKGMRRSKMDPEAGEQRTVRPELARSRQSNEEKFTPKTDHLEAAERANQPTGTKPQPVLKPKKEKLQAGQVPATAAQKETLGNIKVRK